MNSIEFYLRLTQSCLQYGVAVAATPHPRYVPYETSLRLFVGSGLSIFAASRHVNPLPCWGLFYSCFIASTASWVPWLTASELTQTAASLTRRGGPGSKKTVVARSLCSHRASSLHCSSSFFHSVGLIVNKSLRQSCSNSDSVLVLYYYRPCACVRRERLDVTSPCVKKRLKIEDGDQLGAQSATFSRLRGPRCAGLGGRRGPRQWWRWWGRPVRQCSTSK